MDTPLMLQFWMKPGIVPAYLSSNVPFKSSDYISPSANNGVEMLPDLGLSVNIGLFHKGLTESGLVLTHASRHERVKTGSNHTKVYEKVCFHYFPRVTAQVHEGVDTSKLTECLAEICRMSFWHVRIHRNQSEYEPWFSVNADSRVQRYVGDDPEQPMLVRVRDEKGNKTEEKEPLKPQAALVVEGNLPVLAKL